MTRPRHSWTEEDAAFFAAQWASGISQREIASYFGYANSSSICSQIMRFVTKYGGIPEWDVWSHGDRRKRLIKDALAAFVERRNARFEVAC